MSLNRTRIWLIACGLQFLLASAAHAQSTASTEDDFLPGSFGDMQLFDRADSSSYGGGARRQSGYFFNWRYAQLAINAPSTTTIGRDGFNPLTFDGVGFNTQANSLNTGFIAARLRSASRIELGYTEDNVGWMLSSTMVHQATQRLVGQHAGISFFSPFVNGLNVMSSFVDATGPLGIPDQIDDDLNGNNVYGRFGIDLGTPNGNPPPAFIPPLDGIPDAPAPVDYGDVAQLPIYFDTVTVQNTNSAWGIEMMRIWQMPSQRFGGQWDFIGGARYFRFKEGFLVDAKGDVVLDDAGVIRVIGLLADSAWNTKAENNLVGPQVGLRWSNTRGRWTISAQGRFTAAANFQQVRQVGYIADPPNNTINADPTTPTILYQPTPTSPAVSGRPFNVFPTAFKHVAHMTEFSPLTELRIDASYRMFRSLSLDVGFTYLYTDNIARPSNMVDYQLLTMGILTQNNRQDLQIFGVNAGISLSY